jgi:Protein of unknown function (DUF4232)
MCVAALATGCAASNPSPAPSATGAGASVSAAASAPVSVPPLASPSAPSPSSAVSIPASAAPAGPAACPTRSLNAKIGVSQGTAGSVYTVIDFTNISHTTCTLYGYPGVALAGGTPVTQIGLAAKQSGTAARTLVTLAPGESGNALLRIVDAGNVPSSSCAPVTADYLQIYPPNQTTPIYLAYTSQTCSKPVQILTIGVVQAGSGSAS